MIRSTSELFVMWCVKTALGTVGILVGFLYMIPNVRSSVELRELMKLYDCIYDCNDWYC